MAFKFSLFLRKTFSFTFKSCSFPDFNFVKILNEKGLIVLFSLKNYRLHPLQIAVIFICTERDRHMLLQKKPLRVARFIEFCLNVFVEFKEFSDKSQLQSEVNMSIQSRKYANQRPTLALKLREYVTKSSKQGYQGLQKRTDIHQNCLKVQGWDSRFVSIVFITLWRCCFVVAQSCCSRLNLY